MSVITLLLQFNRSLYLIVLVVVKFIIWVNCLFHLSYAILALMPHEN
jgi:hypothetical protein